MQSSGVRLISVIGVLATVTGMAFSLLNPPDAEADDTKKKVASSERKTEKTVAKSVEPADDRIDPMSVNATCYVCHMTFVREEISKAHFREKVTCVKCHGLSAAHANDEDIGATKPDIMYRRDQVDAMCRKCHEKHDVPAEEVIARFLQRKPTASPVVCTDCHGEHAIAAASGDEKNEKK